MSLKFNLYPVVDDSSLQLASSFLYIFLQDGLEEAF